MKIDNTVCTDSEKQKRFLGLVNAFIGNSCNTHRVYDAAKNDKNKSICLISEEWDAKGASGGSCWDTDEDDGARDYYNEMPTNTPNFIFPVFMGFFPQCFRKMSFEQRERWSQYWTINNCETQTKTEHEYYGNWSQYNRLSIGMDKLYNLIMSNVESGEFGDCPWFPKEHGRLFIIAGLPGSGKSEFAKCITTNCENIFDDPKERPNADNIINKIINDRENVVISDPNFSTASRLSSCVEYYSKILQELGYIPDEYIVKVYFNPDSKQCSENAIHRNTQMSLREFDTCAFKIVKSAIRLMQFDAECHFPVYQDLKENEFMFPVWNGLTNEKLKQLYASGVLNYKEINSELLDFNDWLCFETCNANITIYFNLRPKSDNQYADEFYHESKWSNY